jgi:hypothetical protein
MVGLLTLSVIIYLVPTNCTRSPSGNIILTKLTRSIKVWTEVCLAYNRLLHNIMRLLLRTGGRMQQNNRSVSSGAIHLLAAWR